MKKKSIIEFLIVLLVTTSGLTYLNNWEKKFKKSLLESGNFAIGNFVKFSMGYYLSGRSYHYYYYNKQRKKVFTTGSRGMPEREMRNKMKKGDQFFVIYNNDGASIFFDKPIKDSTDYKRYVKEFEEKRKQKTKKKN